LAIAVALYGGDGLGDDGIGGEVLEGRLLELWFMNHKVQVQLTERKREEPSLLTLGSPMVSSRSACGM
jgi:hypothetical protein